jgi:hypothetical protein
VRNEIEIFSKAVIKVNNMTTVIIDPNLSLLELVKDNVPKFKTVLVSEISCIIFNNKSEIYKEYYKNVWESYLELGGDSKVVIHGYIELLLQKGLEPTSMTALTHVDKILNNLSLQNEMNNNAL